MDREEPLEAQTVDIADLVKVVEESMDVGAVAQALQDLSEMDDISEESYFVMDVIGHVMNALRCYGPKNRSVAFYGCKVLRKAHTYPFAVTAMIEQWDVIVAVMPNPELTKLKGVVYCC
jgi:hypothetical protein